MKSIADMPKDTWPHTLLHTFLFIKDASGFFDSQQQKHGEVFRCQLFGKQQVRVHGPDYAHLLYKNSNESVLAGPAWEPNIGAIFPNGLLLKDQKNHITHRRIMQHAFNKDAMLQYFDHIQTWSQELVDELSGADEVDFFPWIKEKTLDLALRMFLGIDYKQALGKEIAQAFIDCVAATLAIVRLPVMNNKFHRGIKGRDTLRAAFISLIELRRQSPQDDLVSFLCQACDEDSNTFSDEQVIDHLIFTMMAAHDTTASSLTSVMYFLTQHPQWQSILHTEAQATSTLHYHTLPELTQAEHVFKEAIRLFPPLVTTPRQLNKDIEFEGYKIPAGTRSGINIFNTHRDPRYWQNPSSFDPTRFDRKEDKNHPYQFIPFGGGVHKCIGMHLSMMESKLLLTHLCKNFEITSLSQQVEFKAVPIWSPKSQFRLRFKKR